MSNSVPSFYITEDISSNPISVELKDTDLPFGFPREVVAFESGGKTEIAEDGIYNPGSDRPVLQVMQPKERPLVVKGRFRDRIYAGAAQGDSSTHARFMRDQLEKIRRRANPVKIEWNGDKRSGLLWETRFGEESKNDITYELTFFIAVPPNGAVQNQVSLTKPAPSIDDLRLQMSILVAALTANTILNAINAGVFNPLSSGLAGVTSALNTLGLATSALERATSTSPQALQFGVNRVVSASQAVQSNITTLKATLDSTRADAALLNVSSDSVTSYWNFLFLAETTLDQVFDAMRQIKLQALAQIKQATRLYRVQPNDSLESIAFGQLGSKARAQDLGIRPDQLVVGRYIRIPQQA